MSRATAGSKKAVRAPARIGRYEILGRIGAGGMAEVFLGRLRGPHGFERPVVVKRILPHLADKQAVEDLFLDEARIIASLRHPNLINVHELGRADGELFLVMEYLEGETVAGICRRLAQRGELIDFTLAAYIIAEACAGLHAAHDAESPDGKALGIVHRDVSPQNLFVGYAGGVHVIDFGIATAADRITRTETGLLRGKFDYMSPEQAKTEKVDRRTDLFAAGIVLFELVTGRRLYRRPTQAATIVAILTEPVPDLSAHRADVPQELREICRKALAKKAADRFESALEMRRALLAFVRKYSDDDPGDRLARFMRDMFPERIEQKQMLVRECARDAVTIDGLPAGEVDEGVEIPVVEAPITNVVAVGARRRGRVLRAIGVAAALLAAVGLGVASSTLGARASDTTSAATTVIAAPPSPTPDVPAPAASTSAAASTATPEPLNEAADAGVAARPPAPTKPAAKARSVKRPSSTPRPSPSLW